MNQSFKNAGMSRPRALIQGAAAKGFARSQAVARLIKNAGEVADFVTWQRRQFGQAKIFTSREVLWSKLASRMNDGRTWHGLEFGVAWGYASAWWLNKLPPSKLSTWDGFDRFTGLPRAWRQHEAGVFDAQGKPPAIGDERVVWHVGDVENTLAEISIPAIADGGRFILFDLDIYEPTVAAWEFMRPLLRPGDLLYFDEALDTDERRVLNELVLPSFSCEYVGGTSASIGLAIK